jgi:hypothetical protein
MLPLLASCSGVILDAASKAKSTTPKPAAVALSSPAANAYINNANKSAFVLAGSCSPDGRSVVVSGAALGSAICAGGAWSLALNLTAVADSDSVTFYADLSDAQGTAAPQSSRIFRKDTELPLAGTLSLINPAIGTGISSTPEVGVSGIEAGDTISIHDNDPTCSQASRVATGLAQIDRRSGERRVQRRVSQLLSERSSCGGGTICRCR